MRVTIGKISEPITPLTPTVLCGEVYGILTELKDTLALPVVSNGRAIGLVNRNDLLLHLANQFGRALYERKPITHLMDREPLVVDENLPLADFNDLLLNERPAALVRGFIVTRVGLYQGVGTPLSLLRLMAASMAHRAEELERAREAEARTNRAKTRFLANMSHELRTPLNAIIGFTEMIEKSVFGPVGHPKYAEYLADILTSAQHLLGVINGILDLSRIEAGRLELAESVFDLNEAISSAMRVVKSLAERGQIQLSVATDRPLPSILGEERKIIQVLVNLLSNAVKFTSPGGHIVVRARADLARGLTLTVSDDGIGIAPDHLDLVMEPFGQVESELNRKYEGTGLGLPLSKAFVELHGGSLTLRSTPGRGIAVTVHLGPERLVFSRDDVDTSSAVA